MWEWPGGVVSLVCEQESGVLSAWEVGGVRRVGGMMAAAALGWTRKESGMDGANSHGAGEVGQTKVYGFGIRFIVKVVEVATFNRR